MLENEYFIQNEKECMSPDEQSQEMQDINLNANNKTAEELFTAPPAPTCTETHFLRWITYAILLSTGHHWNKVSPPLSLRDPVPSPSSLPFPSPSLAPPPPSLSLSPQHHGLSSPKAILPWNWML
jgi:hypothetical protein